MMRRRILVVLALILAAVCMVSLLLVPERVADPKSAIPPFARIVFQGGDIDRFSAVFPNPGTPEEGFSSHWKKTFQGLEKHPLTAASFYSNGREGLVLIAALSGWDALGLRWRMTLFPPGNVSAARPYAVWPVWRLEMPGRMRVRFSVTEGFLICSISPDSRDIHRVLDALDGRGGR